MMENIQFPNDNDRTGFRAAFAATSVASLGQVKGGQDGLSGTSPMNAPSREEISAQIAASEAKSETKIARLEGKIDLVLSKIGDLKDDARTNRSNQWVIALGLAGLIVAVAALFPVFFGIGAQVKEIVDHYVDSALKK